MYFQLKIVAENTQKLWSWSAIETKKKRSSPVTLDVVRAQDIAWFCASFFLEFRLKKMLLHGFFVILNKDDVKDLVSMNAVKEGVLRWKTYPRLPLSHTHIMARLESNFERASNVTTTLLQQRDCQKR